MRHKRNHLLELEVGEKNKSNVIRTMLTNLIKHGQMETTSKRAKVMKSEADQFFGRLLRMFDLYKDEKDVRREAIRFVKSVVYGEDEGKKVVNELLPKYKASGKNSGFVSDYKLGYRVGDGAEKILIRLD